MLKRPQKLLFLGSFIISLCTSCNLFHGVKVKNHLTPPNDSAWSIKSTEKGLILLQNGQKLNEVSGDLKYIDMISGSKKPDEDIYLYQVSGCRDCEGLKALYFIAPKLNVMRRNFYPAAYYSIDPSNNEKILDFKGEVYYGKCSDSFPAGIFLDKTEYLSNENSQDHQENSLLVKNTMRFFNPYWSLKKKTNLEIGPSEQKRIRKSAKSKSNGCFHLQSAGEMIIPM